MAHATYLFLIDKHPSDLREEDAEELFSDLKSDFDVLYGYDRCDENNWYTVYGAVTKDGRFLGTDEFVESWTKSYPDPERRFEALLRFAVSCMAYEMEICGVDKFALPGDSDKETPLDKMSRADLIEAIYEEVPKALAKAYAQFTRDAKDSFDMAGYRRARLAQMFERFHYATIKPFATEGSPYEYRCFDLREDSDAGFDANSVILLVDIHT